MTLFVIPVRKDSVAITRLFLGVGVRVSDVRYCNENFEWVLLIWLAYASLYFALDLCFSLLTMTVTADNILYQLDKVRGDEGKSLLPAEPEFLLVAPKHGWPCRHTGL